MMLRGRRAPRGVSAAAAIAAMLAVALLGCSSSEEPNGGNGSDIPATDMEYVVFVWNDLGMHCLNPTYDQAVILPPYNTVWAQVVRRGNPPQIVTSGLTVEYRMVDNTYSYGKTDPYGGDFAQFWDNAQALFGVALEHDRGLNLVDPAISNGLSGTMVAKGDHFQVDGIPVVPVNDAGAWDPYQVIEVTVKQNGTVIGQTRATVPTSDEIDCAKCHGASDPFGDVLASHDQLHGTNLSGQTPVLCANGVCHTSPALGQAGEGSDGYLSQVIHEAHADRNAACMDCHPGAVTRCSRSLAHSAADGNCITCHGTMQQVASSIESGQRTPWFDEPTCASGTCHDGVAEVGSQASLYRNTTGHHGMYCPACHNSPHAMYPSREATDDYQPEQYQAEVLSIGSCGVCHSSSRGDDEIDEFGEEHGGTGGRATACSVCHTVVPTNTAQWPHGFTWKAR
jgi:hypothetical protein